MEKYICTFGDQRKCLGASWSFCPRDLETCTYRKKAFDIRDTALPLAPEERTTPNHGIHNELTARNSKEEWLAAGKTEANYEQAQKEQLGQNARAAVAMMRIAERTHQRLFDELMEMIGQSLDAVPGIDGVTVLSGEPRTMVVSSAALTKNLSFSPQDYDIKRQTEAIKSKLFGVRSVNELVNLIEQFVASKVVHIKRDNIKLAPGAVACLEELLKYLQEDKNG